jgi:hypothetical protein
MIGLSLRDAIGVNAAVAQAVAVELDLVNPPLSRRYLSNRGFNEAGELAL